MKKIYLAFALLATLSIVSCVENEQFGEEGVNLTKNGIAFRFSGVQTKSSEAMEPSETLTGISIPLGKDDSGATIFLTESVVDLNAYVPETKGAPIYHQNVLSLKDKGYGKIDVKTYLKGGAAHAKGNAVFDSIDEEGATGGWLYSHDYGSSPWPSNPAQDVNFYLALPATSNASNFTYGPADGNMEFDYTSASTAEAQKDILVGYTMLNKNQYDQSYKTTGAPVMFYHALTGVKFRVGNNNSNDTKTIITKVVFKKLYGGGHGVFNPSTGMITWTPNTEATFTQEFASYTYDRTKDNTIDYISGDNNKFGNSWYTGGTAEKPYNKNNLNNEDGSWTFWFVPQTFADHAGVTLEITYKIYTPDTTNGIEHSETIDLSAVLGASSTGHPATVWKSGQLRTYTLEPRYVDVEINDTMSTDGMKKSNLRVTNTGNVDEYVRMLVIGNWYGWESEIDYQNYLTNGSPEPNILVGYKYAGNELEMDPKPDYYDANDFASGKDGYNTMTRAWFRADEVYGQGFDLSFKFGKPTGSGWVKAHGGYYYPDPIGPGELFDVAGASQSAVTTPIFKSYELQEEWIPKIYIPDPNSNIRREAVGVHLVMEVVVQAISTKDKYGNLYEDYKAAWIDATGDEGYFNK